MVSLLGVFLIFSDILILCLIMGCYRPLHLVNPKFNPTYRDKVFIDVPCGKCAYCRKRQKNDWFVRSYFEYLENKEKHGTTFYVTLTYRDDRLPLYDDVPVFSRRDIQLFLKRLRKYCKDEWQCDCVRYIITSEYGTLGRPHYHGLLFCSVPNMSVYDIQHFKYFVTQAWLPQNGFVSFGRKGQYKIRGVVENSAAVSYVAKYICKDLDFPVIDNPFPQMSDYTKDLNDDSSSSDIDAAFDNFRNDLDSYKEKLREINRVKPFHLQSKGFGQYMIDHYGLDNNSVYSFRMLVDGTFCLGSVSQFNYGIPQYITRKVLYDYHYKQIIDVIDGKNLKYSKIDYILNDLGKRVKKQRELHSVEYFVTELNTYLNQFEHLCFNDFNTDEVSYILSHCSLTFDNPDLWILIDFVRDTFGMYSDLDKQSFALYTHLFKDRVVVPNSQFGFCDDLTTTLCDAKLYLDEIYNEDNLCLGTLGLEKRAKSDKLYYTALSDISTNTYAHTLHDERYRDYEYLLQIFNSVIYLLGCRAENNIRDKEKLEKNSKLACPDVV